MTFDEYNTDENFDKKESSLDELVKLGASEGKSLDDIKGSLSPKWQTSKELGEIGNYYNKYSVKPQTEEKAEIKETVEETKPQIKDTTSYISNKDKNFYEKQAGLADNAENTEYERQNEEELKRRDTTLDRMKFSGEAFKNIDDHYVEQLPTFIFRRYQNGEFGEPGSTDAKLRMGHFMINNLGTALTNASNVIRGKELEQSEYEKLQNSNLEQGIANRWNKNKADTEAAIELLRKQNMDEQEIQGSIAKVSANARLQSAFNMMNENQKVYTLQVLSKIGNEIGNMNNKDFINTLIGFATSGDNLEWQEAAELLLAKFGPDALKGLKNIKDEDSMDDADTNTAGVGGGGNLKNYKTIDGDTVSFDMFFTNGNGGKEKLAKLTKDLSEKYYNGEIDEETFRKYYTPLYEEGKKHTSIKVFSPDDVLKKNNEQIKKDTKAKADELFGKNKKEGKKALDYFKASPDLFKFFSETEEPNFLAAKDATKVKDMKDYMAAEKYFKLLKDANALDLVKRW